MNLFVKIAIFFFVYALPLAFFWKKNREKKDLPLCSSLHDPLFAFPIFLFTYLFVPYGLGWYGMLSPVVLFCLFIVYIKLFTFSRSYLFPVFPFAIILFFGGFGYLQAVVASEAIRELFSFFSMDAGQGQEVVNSIAEIENPGVLFVRGIMVVGFVPFIEEVLFRGVFHDSLRTVLNKRWSDLLVSIVFVLMHYHPNQGVGNVVVFFTLFPLSFYLIFLKNKFFSLIPGIIVHMIFNGIGFFLLIMT